MGEGWEGALEGVGPENRDFLGLKWHRVKAMHQKIANVPVYGACLDFDAGKTITSRAI